MKEKVSYYDWVVQHDVIDYLKLLLDRRAMHLRLSDGKLEATGYPVHTSPWHHVRQAYDKDCGLWHQVIFDVVGGKLPSWMKFVPSKCHQCWKVVVRPKTLKQLFALLELEKKIDMPSKCGIEVRETVHGLYGGYFYNNSLKEGLACYEMVRKEIDADKYLGKDIPVVLKRACTEFELACGDSRKWAVPEWQLAIEQLVDRYVVKEDVLYQQPDHVLWNIHRRWIEWAYQNGDETYKEFTNGRPLFTASVTYQHLVGADEKTIEKFFKAEPPPKNKKR